MDIILATGNKGKVSEFAVLLGDLGVKVYGLKDFDLPNVVEDGNSFSENALKKARSASMGTKLWAVADDSGLVVDALNGAPGIYSARFAGENATDDENIDKLLTDIANVEDNLRSARFMCAVAVVSPSGDEWVFEGSCEGNILHERVGEQGFGYDSVFYSNELEKSFGVCDMNEKNIVSHRGKAVKKAVDFLRSVWEA